MRVKIHKNNAERQKAYRLKKAEKGRFTNLRISIYDMMALKVISDKLSIQKKIITYALRYKYFRFWCKINLSLWKDIDSLENVRRVKDELKRVGEWELGYKVRRSILQSKLYDDPKRIGDDYRTYNRRHEPSNKDHLIRIFIPYIVDNIFFGKTRGNPSSLLRYALKYVMFSILLGTDSTIEKTRNQIKTVFSQRLDTVDARKVVEEKLLTDLIG
jgi:hypothetical protein